MISREPTLERLATARQLLLEPFGLDDTHLARALAEIRAHQVDDADLYFQYTRSEGWSLEEGIVKTGSFSIDQGVGVRAVSGEKTAFAYSDDISAASLWDAARTVRSIAAAGQAGRARAARQKIAKSRNLYVGADPIASLDSTAKVRLLETVEQRARAKDARIVQVMAGLASEYDVVLVARADGTLAADVRPLVRLSLTVIAQQGERREIGQTEAPAPASRAHLAAAVLLGDDGDRQAHQRAHVGGHQPIGTRHQHHVVLAGQARHDLHHARVLGAGTLLGALQQAHLVGAVHRGDGVDVRVQ